MNLYRKLLTVAFCYGIAGCTSSAVPVRLYTQDEARPATEAGEYAELLDEASILLGLPIELVGYTRGAIQLEILEVAPGQYVGRKFAGSRCWKFARSIPHSRVIAHELGHALGLDHVDDTHNLMAAPNGSESTGLTESQRDTMDRVLTSLHHCI